MKLSLISPENKPATWHEVRHWRDIHEVAPIETTQGLFDCDDRSDKRLSEQLDMFDYLDTLNPDGTLDWKRADNTWVPLSKEQLANVYQEIRIAKAIRSGRLHRRAESFANMDVMPTVNQIKQLAYWLS